MVHITSMPQDIIMFILMSNDITMQDIMNFTLTCKHFYNMVNNEPYLWKYKFLNKRLILKKLHNTYWSDTKVKNKVLERVRCKKKDLSYFMKIFYKKDYQKELSEINLKDLVDFVKTFCNETSTVFQRRYVVDELDELRNVKWVEITHLMDKYFIHCEFSDYLKEYFKFRWQLFSNPTSTERILELIESFNTDKDKPKEITTYSRLKTSLDNISKNALNVLKEEHPEHSIFSVPREQLPSWRNNMHDNIYWSKTETKQILVAISKVMFSGLNIINKSKNASKSVSYFKFNKLLPDAIYINKVLQHSPDNILIITLLFENVARRLGLFFCDYYICYHIITAICNARI